MKGDENVEEKEKRYQMKRLLSMRRNDGRSEGRRELMIMMIKKELK